MTYTFVDYYLFTTIDPLCPIEWIRDSLLKLCWRGRVCRIRSMIIQDPGIRERSMGHLNGGFAYIIVRDPSVHSELHQKWLQSLNGYWFQFFWSHCFDIGLRSRKDQTKYARSIFEADFSVFSPEFSLDPYEEFIPEKTYFSNIREYRCNKHFEVQDFDKLFMAENM